MFTLSGRQQYLSGWILISSFGILNALQDHLGRSPPVKVCPGSQLLCGDRTCYDPATRICTEHGKVTQCVSVCGNQCYNSNTHHCLNGTICRLFEQLCTVKYDIYISKVHNSLSNQCYNPKDQACLNNTLCDRSQVCNHQCLEGNQLCVRNKTVCNFPNGNWYYVFRSTLTTVESCNGICYNTSIQHCINNTLRCADNNNCSGTCYNSSTHKCLNGTICTLRQQVCDTYSPYMNQCYDPIEQLCYNNTLCNRASRSCKQQCLQNNQICVNDNTICNTTLSYDLYNQNQIQLCDGICYDTSVHRCVRGNLEIISTTIVRVSSDRRWILWGLSSIDCYIIILFCMVIYCILRLSHPFLATAEKSVHPDLDQIQLIKNDQSPSQTTY
ncbi:unnamed protein product [Adineta ricciae]|uniref:Uncharacterized protein n=1 Tax=Adineta ricciae TaxID=249248 RepID=A0A813QQB9_ADIRI|nr:unnamed protein product [Adineta ricciae]CAF1381451.1 unnamed protein product [Adineta ricciae]